MVTGRHIVGLMADGLSNGEGGKAAATIIAAAESLDWNSWYSQAGGAQIAPGELLQDLPIHDVMNCLMKDRCCVNGG